MPVTSVFMLAPVPTNVPPQLFLYHFHCAPVPRIPPFTVSVTVALVVTVVDEADAETGATLLVLIAIVSCVAVAH